MASGDFSGNIVLRTGDNSSLMAAVSRMTHNLRGLIGTLTRLSNDVNRNMDSIAQAIEQTTGDATRISQASQTLQTMADELSHRLHEYRL